jgi:hypothetical protein
MITKETDNFEVNWEEKQNKIFWRGATTGGGSSPPGHLHQYQRHRSVAPHLHVCKMDANHQTPLSFQIEHSLVQIASTSSRENTTVVFPKSSTHPSTSFIQVSLPAASVNPDMFDIGFTSAVGCQLYKDGGCAQMRQELTFRDAVQLADHWKYKYLIDVDGMGYSAHFLAFMASESAVLKSTVYREFFSDWIQPW